MVYGYPPPYGPGPYAQVGQGQGAPLSVRPAQDVDVLREGLATLFTIVGIVAFGAAGAGAGYLLGGTRTAALIGAIAGLAVPPLASAATQGWMRE
jgi:hypothetical protein